MKPYKTRQKGAVSVLLIIFMLLSASTAGIIYAISKRKPLPTLPSPIAEHRQAMPTATPDLTKTTTDPNWDVYVSESCGIEFRYPKGYLASMDDDYCHFFIAENPSNRYRTHPLYIRKIEVRFSFRSISRVLPFRPFNSERIQKKRGQVL